MNPRQDRFRISAPVRVSSRASHVAQEVAIPTNRSPSTCPLSCEAWNLANSATRLVVRVLRVPLASNQRQHGRGVTGGTSSRVAEVGVCAQRSTSKPGPPRPPLSCRTCSMPSATNTTTCARTAPYTDEHPPSPTNSSRRQSRSHLGPVVVSGSARLAIQKYLQQSASALGLCFLY